MARRVPSPEEIQRRAIEGQLLDVRTSMAGTIVSFDANTMRATVRPGVRVLAVDLDSPAEVDTLPDISDVPVLFPSCAFGILYWPLAAGDPVRLEFSEQDDSEFYWNADAVVPVNPGALRRHGSACVCRPEGTRGTGALGAEDAAKMFLGKPGGVGIQMDHSEVRLGGSAASMFAALAPLVEAAISHAIANHTHMYAPGPSAAVPSATGVLAGALPSTAASKVKAL